MADYSGITEANCQNVQFKSVNDLDTVANYDRGLRMAMVRAEFVGGANEEECKLLRFGMSSLPCVLADHPIEIVSDGEELQYSDEAEQPAAELRWQHLIGEMRELAATADVEWALLSTEGRGPCLPELAAAAIPFGVDCSCAYFNNRFADLLGKKVRSRSEEWEHGLFAAWPWFSENECEEEEFSLSVWRTLRQWHSRYRALTRSQ